MLRAILWVGELFVPAILGGCGCHSLRAGCHCLRAESRLKNGGKNGFIAIRIVYTVYGLGLKNRRAGGGGGPCRLRAATLRLRAA
jgi:hypothetical protein